MSEDNFIPWIAFDFDGVIAKYDGFIAHDHVGVPNKKVVEAMRALREKGCKIIIHSTRGDTILKKYCEENDIPYDYINRNPEREGENKGKPIATIYIDDRALNYHGQNADELLQDIKSFRLVGREKRSQQLKEYWED